MTDRPVKIGSISAQILALMLTDEHYRDRLKLLFDLSAALNRDYHALADAGAPLVQIEEPAVHQVMADPNATIAPAQWVEAFNAEVAGLRGKCEVWCHTCWAAPPPSAWRAVTSPTGMRCPISIDSTWTSSPSRGHSTAA